MNSSNEVYKRALALFSVKQYTKAQELLEKNTDCNSDCLSLLANCLIRNGNIAKARKVSGLAVEMNPNSSYAWRNFSWCLYNAKKFAECLETAKKSLELDLSDVRNYSALARAYYGCKYYEKAISVAQDGLNIKPDNTYCMYWLAVALRDIGRRDESVKVFYDSLSVDPLDVYAHRELAEMYFLELRFDKCRNHSLNGVRLDPTFFEFRHLLACCHIASNTVGRYCIETYAFTKRQSLFFKVCLLPVVLPIILYCAILSSRYEEVTLRTS